MLLQHTMGRIIAAAILLTGWASIVRGEECPPAGAEVRAVAQIVDAATVRLDDGSDLRLTSLIAPSARDVASTIGDWPPEVAAKDAVDALLRERRIEIAIGMDGVWRTRFSSPQRAAALGYSLQSSTVDTPGSLRFLKKQPVWRRS